MFCDRHGDAHYIGFLKRVAPDHSGIDLSRDSDERHAVQICVGKTGDEIGRTRTGGRYAYAGSPRRLRVAGCGMDNTLLVPHYNRFNRVAAMLIAEPERVKKLEDGGAGIAEHRIHTLDD